MYHVIVNAFLGNYMRCKTQVAIYGRRTFSDTINVTPQPYGQMRYVFLLPT